MGNILGILQKFGQTEQAHRDTHDRSRCYSFENIFVDPANRILLRDGKCIPVSPRGFQILLLLLARQGQLVSRSEILATIWPDTTVDPSNVTVTISLLRKALGDDHMQQRCIQTVSKAGYRFVSIVSVVPRPAQPSADSSRTAHRAPIVPRILASVRQLARIPSLKGRALLTACVAMLVWVLRPGNNNTPREAHQSSTATTLAQPNRERANRYYTRGRFCWNLRTPNGLLESVSYYQQALREDPAFAPAYAGLSESYALLPMMCGSAPEAARKAKEAAYRALLLDADSAEAHAVLAMVAFLYESDWSFAGREFETARRLGPSDATVLHWSGLYLATKGRSAEALNELRRASQIDPASCEISTDLAWAFYYQKRYRDAAATLKRIISLDPNFPHSHTLLAKVYLQQGRVSEALHEAEAGVQLSNAAPHNLAVLGLVFASTTNNEAAAHLLDELKKRADSGVALPVYSAYIWMGLGKTQQTLDTFELAAGNGQGELAFALLDPSFERLRSDIRFQHIVHRLGLNLINVLTGGTAASGLGS
jgi:DNA-binding winged helix-turn-helix (wHTH) protein/Tfp pilus assembly protein PilF